MYKKRGFDKGAPTPPVDEGPYYKPGSPEKARLFEKGVPGEKLVLSGIVSDLAGHPLAHAWLDFWQADGEGNYDNSGFVLRGHQYTGKSGIYLLETVMPGSYPGRTPHIHVKLRAHAESPVFTTQLFIPGLASNETDFLYREELQMEIRDAAVGKAATFNFVLKG